MPDNTSNSNLGIFDSWAETQGFRTPRLEEAELNDDLQEMRLLGYRSKIAPGKSPSELFEALLGLLFADGPEKVCHSPVAHSVITDPRLPGWVRLAAALCLGDVTQTKELSRHSVTLVQYFNPEKHQLFAPNLAALEALTPARSLRLLSSGVKFEARFSLDQIIEVVKNSNSWVPNMDITFTHVKWEGAFNDQLPKILTLKDMDTLTPVQTFTWAAKLFSETQPEHAKDSELVKDLLKIANLLTLIPKREDWPKQEPNLFSLRSARLLLDLTSPSTPEYSHLAAICVVDGMRGFKRSEFEMGLLKDLSNRDSSWVLPPALKLASETDTMTVLLELSKDLEGNATAIKDTLSNFNFFGYPKWIQTPLAKELHSKLGPFGPGLLRTTTDSFADAYRPHPVRKRHRRDLKVKDPKLGSFPQWVKEAMVSQNSGIKSQDNARAFMIDKLYVPQDTEAFPVGEHVITSLRDLMTQSADGTLSKEGHTSALAWVRKVGVQHIGKLITNASSMPVEISTVLHEALGICTSGDARRIVLSAVNSPEPFKDHTGTLLTFAKEISNTIDKASK